MTDLENVFVYGTLRPPRSGAPARATCNNPYVAPYVETATPARLLDANLFDTGGFPVARPGTGVVHGDLLTVTPRGVAMMDQIEGHPNFFRRERVQVETEGGPVEAWIYWGPENLAARSPQIESGDWFER